MAESTTNVRNSRSQRWHHLIDHINLFDTAESLTHHDQLIATRILLLLFTTALILIFTFATFTAQTYYTTIPSPSEDTFAQLAARFADTISCPCSQSAVRTDAFLTFRPSYHRICSSSFVNQSFIAALVDANRSAYHVLDYRVTVVAHFRVFALLCQTVANMVSNALNEFAAKHMITTTLLSYAAFDAQADQLVEQLITTSTAEMQHISDFLWLNIVENSIYSALRTNYQMQIKPTTVLTTFSRVSYTSKNGTCYCTGSTPCTQEAAFYDLEGFQYVRDVITNSLNYRAIAQVISFVPGLQVGCLPYDSLLRSSLECLYSQSCIDQLIPFIPAFSTVSPLPSSSSRFPQAATVQDLFDQLFIESWQQTRRFSSYFQACAPYSCTYSQNGRLNVLYAVVTILSVFSGLQMLMPIFTLVLVKIFRRVQRCCQPLDSTSETPINTHSDSIPRWREQLMSLVRQVKTKVVSFNMFPSSDVTDGLYSTRLYVVALAVAVVVLVFYSSLSVQIENVTVDQPSLTEYERLYAEHPSTLKCPCTRLSVPFSSIVHIEPYYHQVCTSDFVKDDGWLLYFIRGAGLFSIFDFRVVGWEFFRVLQSLCKMSKEKITNELATLNNMQFVSTELLSNETFQVQISAIIRQFEQQTIDSFLGLFELVRLSIQLNQFIINASPNAVVNEGGADGRTVRFLPKVYFDGGCSCGKNVSCTRPQGFYCRTSACKGGNPSPAQTIPGLVSSCLFVDSLLASSLQCLFNASCIQMLFRWRSYGLSDAEIPTPITTVAALDPTVVSRFPPDTILKNVVSQLFVERWTDVIDFQSYYRQCAPQQCSYTYEARFNKAYIVATVLGVIGGLSIVLKLIIPLLFKACRRAYRYHRQRRSEASMRRECMQLAVYIYQRLQMVNVYRKVSKTRSTNDERLIIERQRTATRCYLICFVATLTLIVIVMAFDSHTYSVTVASPSLATFESLHGQYASTLSCPCSRIAIAYSEFMSVQPTYYHPICSSYFVTWHFINLLWGVSTPSDFFLNIDGKILSTEFRFLAMLCSLAQQIVEQKRRMFAARELISLETSARQSFELQVDSITKTFTVQTEAEFRVVHEYIIEMISANQLHNLFFTNWDFRISTEQDGYYLTTYPMTYTHNNHACSCETSAACSRTLLTKDNKSTKISGLLYGCLPVFGLRLSTLECLYNATCLQAISALVGNTYIPAPLSMPTRSRFKPVSTVLVGTMMDALFIEAWQNQSNYSDYFSFCAPASCRYTYVERNSAFNMLTTFLGLYGGLTLILKFVVYHSLRFFWTKQRCLSRCQNQVEPVANNQ